MKKEINVLVTAGDTYEAIDDVRKVTHMATGRLGSLIADEFSRYGAAVTFVCGENSLRPSLPVRKTVEIQGVASLEAAIKEQLSDVQFDCVVHSMAVSDYTVRGLTTEDEIIEEFSKIAFTGGSGTELADNARHVINNALLSTSGKISSDLPSLIVVMDRAPKVISHVKKLQPGAILVGFKLLSGVEEKELLRAAREQMQKSGSDFVLANDLSGINGDNHRGMLIGREGIVDRPATKQEIAKSIVHYTTKTIMEKQSG